MGRRRALLPPSRDLERLLAAATPDLEAALGRVGRAVVEGDADARAAALRRLGDVLAWTQRHADLLGRRRLLLELDAAAGRRVPLAFAAVAAVPFRQAIRDLVEREPRLASTAEEVGRVYSESHGFALARSADLEVTKRVQAILARALRTGRGHAATVEAIRDVGDWTRAYAQTVYRTNAATAYAAGRWREATDPDLGDEVLGWRYAAVMDADTRPNHAAADGLIARVSDPVWNRMAPPIGYNCRCVLEIVTRYDGVTVPRRARLPLGAHPDRYFGGRPDHRFYGR